MRKTLSLIALLVLASCDVPPTPRPDGSPSQLIESNSATNVGSNPTGGASPDPTRAPGSEPSTAWNSSAVQQIALTKPIDDRQCWEDWRICRSWCWLYENQPWLFSCWNRCDYELWMCRMASTPLPGGVLP